MPRVLFAICSVAIALGGRAAYAEEARTAATDISPLLKTLYNVGREGAGHREAMAAWQQLAKADAAQLPAILSGLDQAGPLAANWIRAAAEVVADRQRSSGRKLPLAALEQFVLDSRHSARGRRLAFEWLARDDAGAPDRLIPNMLEDSSLEFRRDAVARLIASADAQAAETATRDAAIAQYVRAFDAARDTDQVKALVEKLTKLEQTVDVPRHFGFVMNWRLIGPFDNTDKKGFAAVYPPEGETNFEATYEGKSGPVRWTQYTTVDPYGEVDLNKAVGKHSGAVVYALAEFDSPTRRDAEVRFGCINANKLWFNGRLLSANEVYHVTIQVDQYVAPVTLERGRNVILIKVCQNEQTEEWAQRWKFQLRVCDPIGTAILSQRE